MNKHLKEFLKRGMLFGGMGPIIAGIVFLIVHFTTKDLSLSGLDVFTAIISTYILSFIHAGASVFNQIEEWSLGKSLLLHMGSLYLSYALCYIINSWIPFEPIALAIFTAIFVVVYFIVWGIVYLSIKAAGKKLNAKLGI